MESMFVLSAKMMIAESARMKELNVFNVLLGSYTLINAMKAALMEAIKMLIRKLKFATAAQANVLFAVQARVALNVFLVIISLKNHVLRIALMELIHILMEPVLLAQKVVSSVYQIASA